MCVCVCVCVCQSTCVPIGGSGCLSVSLCVYGSVHLSVCVCVCVCVFVFVLALHQSKHGSTNYPLVPVPPHNPTSVPIRCRQPGANGLEGVSVCACVWRLIPPAGRPELPCGVAVEITFPAEKDPSRHSYAPLVTRTHHASDVLHPPSVSLEAC